MEKRPRYPFQMGRPTAISSIRQTVATTFKNCGTSLKTTSVHRSRTKYKRQKNKLRGSGRTTARNAVIGATVGGLADAVDLSYAWTVIRDTLNVATTPTNSSADTGGLEQKLDQIFAKNASRQGFEKDTQKIALAYCLAAPFVDMLGGGGFFTAYCLKVAGVVGVFGLASDAQSIAEQFSKLSDLTDCLCVACEIEEPVRQAIQTRLNEIKEPVRQAIQTRLKIVQVQPKNTHQELPDDDPDDSF